MYAMAKADASSSEKAGTSKMHQQEKSSSAQDGEQSPKSQLETGVPKKPNVYSDGSLKQNRCYFQQTGGAGVFWPDSRLEQLAADEARYTQQEQLGEGFLLWASFNSLLNSSTRTELAAAIVAITPPVPVHSGIDNSAMVQKGNQIIRY